MEDNLKSLLLHTLHCNENIRNNAESQLKSIEKNPDIMILIQMNLMRHSDTIVQQTSSIYFVNALKRNWKAPELGGFIQSLESNMMSYLMIEDRYPKQAYDEILQLIFQNSEISNVEELLLKSASNIKSIDAKENEAVLRLYEVIFKSDSLRFNQETLLAIIFDKHGDIMFAKFTQSLANCNYILGKMFMKIISRAYSHYSLPDHLLELQVFKNYYNLAVGITKIQDSEDVCLIKMKKWAYFFLYKSTNKGLKKYFKNAEFISFIKSSDNFGDLTSIFCDIVTKYANGKSIHPRVLLLTCDFFSLICSNKHTKVFIKMNHSFLLSSFILPVLSYNEEIKEIFECDEEQYLRNRHNYVNDQIRSEASSLFTEIIQCDKEVQRTILSSLKGFLDNNKNASNYVSMKYGILGLFAETQRNMINTFGQEAFDEFVVNNIIPELNSEHDFIISQALYFKSLSEEIQLSHKCIGMALNRTLELLGSDHEILPVEACLAMNFFLDNSNISDQMRSLVPGLLEKVVNFLKQYFLESLSSLMDSIIECYAEDVAFYAPQFVDTLCSNIIENIDSKENDKIATVSGFITTIERFIMVTDSKPDVVNKIYQSASRVIYTIFSNSMVDFYQEGFDIMNSFLFTPKSIDESMFQIFKVALSIEKEEIMLYPREVSDFIDNYLSFAKSSLINSESLVKIYNAIDAFIPSFIEEDDYDFYDEDYEAGCRIINSLMLNAGNAVHSANQNLIPCIVHKIINSFDTLDDNTYMDMFGLEAIMNCFIIAPDSVLSSMGGFIQKFFEESYKRRHKFKRVYDKKSLHSFHWPIIQNVKQY